MNPTGSEGYPVDGSVLIRHQNHEGKHQYEVENVLEYKTTKMFVRKGDKLMQINGTDLQDLTPKEVAQILAKPSPWLTVRNVEKIEEHKEQPSPTETTLQPVSKESIMLSFSMKMRREEDLVETEVEQEGLGDFDCQTEDEENGEGKGLFIIAMKKTSITLVKSRGSSSGSHGSRYTLNDVVMVTESSTVTLVPRGSTFKQPRPVEASVEHVASQLYLRAICSQKTVYPSTNPERMTIYHYKSNSLSGLFRGMPVVLNFTESNCFLRCCKEGENVLLRVETCEMHRLKQISEDDEIALSFLFYMKSNRSKQMKFESALHRGWFIQITNTDAPVEVGNTERQDHSFFFIIQT
uniref:Interleukin-1 beta n=1 Tax=Monopterus albus TaxID=43700 RepID=A0A3Q3JIC1_MONAL|nr:uncharacterized protein LOC109965717 [Monopterus albus]